MGWQLATEGAAAMINESRPEDRADDDARAEDSKARVMSHGEMNTAYLSGQAVPLAQSVSWLVRYQGSWWVVYERGWLRVTDDLVEADIDSCASLIADATGGSAREADIPTADRRPVSGEPDK
jgi:hypothetical protein